MCIGPELQAAVAVAGLATSALGASKKRSAQQEIAQASRDAENARRAQMELESQRQRRDIIRKAQAAQAQALTSTTTQTGSAATAGSSALPGAQGQIANAESQQVGFLEANTLLGRDVFDANARKAEAEARAAEGAGLMGMGNALVSGAQSISQIGMSLFGNKDPYATATRPGLY
jgi:hypothetical protein